MDVLSALLANNNANAGMYIITTHSVLNVSCENVLFFLFHDFFPFDWCTSHYFSTILLDVLFINYSTLLIDAKITTVPTSIKNILSFKNSNIRIIKNWSLKCINIQYLCCHFLELIGHYWMSYLCEVHV